MAIGDIPAGEFNTKLAEELKKIPEFERPEWSLFVKTGTHAERVPANEDFWYRRAASILKQISVRGTIGVNRLRTRYGGRKNRGARPEERRKGAGKIIRVILQQAEKANLLEKSAGKKKGRRLTQFGKKLLKNIK